MFENDVAFNIQLRPNIPPDLVYFGIGSTCMYKDHLNSTAFIKHG